MWDPRTLYAPKEVAVIRDAPRPESERPKVLTLPPEPRRPSQRRVNDRAYNLKLLGFKRYRDYIGSALWRGIRRPIVVRANWMCEACKVAPMDVVHHLDYTLETLQGKNPESLIAVCDPCHDEFHSKKRRGKKSPARKKMSAMRRRRERMPDWTPEDDEMLGRWVAGLRMGSPS